MFRLYGAGLGVDRLTDDELAGAVTATDSRTATYIREVVRRAALKVAERQPDGELRVDAATLTEAAADLLDDRAALTRALLGGVAEPDAEPPFTSPGGPGYPGPVTGGWAVTTVDMLRFGPSGPAMPFGPDQPSPSGNG